MLEAIQPVRQPGADQKFSAEDENQFLEIKSVLVQELELIWPPSR